MAAVPRTRARQTMVVVAVALTMTVAGGLGTILVIEQKAGSSPLVVDDGPTLYQALASLNSSVANESGGPWSIFSVMGIAAEGPYSPGVKGYVSFNASVPINGCQEALSGLTMFNGSLPIFTGTFNSGTAPFWQFAYYSNDTSEVLVGTDVLGMPHLFTPFPVSSNCTHAWGDFGLDPSKWTDQIYSNSSLPPNSPLAARLVWGSVDANYLDHHQPLVELFTSGPAMLAATQDLPYGRLGVDFVSCGLAGFTGYGTGWATGYGMAYYSGVNKNGSNPGGRGFNATTNCYLGNTATVLGAVTGAYQLLFSNATASAVTGTTRLTASTAVNFASNTEGEYYDMWGLANWMVSLNLSTSSGQPLAPGAPACKTWVSSMASCAANSSGWYAVLLSQGGEWLASYGTLSNGTGWTVPVTAMVSYQQIIIVTPSSWIMTGDLLTVTSTIPSATVQGSLTL